ncbi:unnamed protein product, partial [marine sediment metagenome]
YFFRTGPKGILWGMVISGAGKVIAVFLKEVICF